MIRAVTVQDKVECCYSSDRYDLSSNFQAAVSDSLY